MIYLKNKWILFLFGFIATMEIIIAFRFVYLIRLVQDLETMVIEQALETTEEELETVLAEISYSLTEDVLQQMNIYSR